MLQEIQDSLREAVLNGDFSSIRPLVRSEHGNIDKCLNVYRNNFLSSLSDFLASTYPVVKRIVGANFFRDLARRFTQTMPPHLPQLSAYGADFSLFLSTFEYVQQLPYLPDVARLEWARAEAYFAADSVPLDPNSLTAVDPVDTINLCFVLHPATRLVTSQHAIYRIWEVNQTSVRNVPRIELNVQESVLVTRPRYEVSTRKIGSGDHAFVAALEKKLSLGQANEIARATDESFDLQFALAAHLNTGTFKELF